MANYYIADLHLNHANVIRYDKRPFADTEEMYHTMLNIWNNCVTETDTVYILGDLCWGKETEWPELIRPFQGRKILIRGNHDPKQFTAETRKLFQDIREYLEITDNGRHVVMCHYPIPFFHADFAENAYMLYGHVHNTVEYDYLKRWRACLQNSPIAEGATGKPNGNFINVGCMMPWMNYAPRTLEEIIAREALQDEKNTDTL